MRARCHFIITRTVSKLRSVSYIYCCFRRYTDVNVAEIFDNIESDLLIKAGIVLIGRQHWRRPLPAIYNTHE